MARQRFALGQIVVPALLASIVIAAVGALIWAFWIAQPSDVPWSELLPAVVGGTIGALAGGIPAYFIARAGSKEVLARDERNRLEQNKASAFRAHVRVGIIVNAVLSLHHQFERMFPGEDASEMEKAHPWLKVLPFAALGTEDLSIDAAEAAIFVAAGEAEYVNDLLLLPRRYAAVTEALGAYRQLRSELGERMPAAVFEGDMGSSFTTEAETRALLPRMIELNSILKQARRNLRADADTALDLARRFGPIMKKHFNDPSFPGFNLDRVPPREGGHPHEQEEDSANP